MKRVAIFTISLRGGGAERIISYLLNEGYKKFEFHLILLKHEIDYPLPKAGNIKIVELEGGGAAKFTGVLKTPFLAQKLKRYLEENGIQTLLSLLVRPNIIACYAKRSGWGGTLIISERADTLAYYRAVPFGFFMIALVRKYYPIADIVTVISKGIAHSLQTLGIKNSKVIYNPVYLSAGRAPAQPAHVPFTFLSMSRFDPQKNIEMLLRAFAGINDTDTKLVLIGKGKLSPLLRKLAASLKISGRVCFAGFQSDVKAWLSKADCMVLSSDYEGFGNVIVEALDSGVPVISTDCPYGPREILAPGTDYAQVLRGRIETARYGILTPVQSAVHMADAMRRMMADDVLRDKYKALGPERAADFDVKKIAKQYFELF